MSEVLVIGDSHSLYNFARIDRIRVRWLGPVTMYRSGRDGFDKLLSHISQTQGSPIEVDEGSSVVFVFGEIDVRLHIQRISDKTGESVDEIIDRLTFNYVNAIDTIVRDKKLFRGIVCEIIPVPKPSICFQNSEYGTLQSRVVIREKLNAALRNQIQGRDIEILGMPRHLTASDGSLKRHFSDGNYHIAPACTKPIATSLSEIIGRHLTFLDDPQPARFFNAIMRRLPLPNRYALLQHFSPFPYDVFHRKGNAFYPFERP